jgi:hypothetical protein
MLLTGCHMVTFCTSKQQGVLSFIRLIRSYSGRCAQHSIQTQCCPHPTRYVQYQLAHLSLRFVVVAQHMLQNAACSVRFFAELAVPVSALTTLWY